MHSLESTRPLSRDRDFSDFAWSALSIAGRLAAWVPLTGSLLLLTFASLAALQVGHWPYYFGGSSHPAPEEVSVGSTWSGATLQATILLLALSTPFAFVVLMLALLPLDGSRPAPNPARRSWPKYLPLAIFATGAIAFFLLLLNLFDWLVNE